MAKIEFKPELVRAINSKADYLSQDGGRMTKVELAEMVLDRIDGDAGKEITKLIDEHGYLPVRNAVARTYC